MRERKIILISLLTVLNELNCLNFTSFTSPQLQRRREKQVYETDNKKAVLKTHKQTETILCLALFHPGVSYVQVCDIMFILVLDDNRSKRIVRAIIIEGHIQHIQIFFDFANSTRLIPVTIERDRKALYIVYFLQKKKKKFCLFLFLL